MKKIILFLVLTFGIKTAFADCESEGLSFFPSQKEISLNSMFMIEGYGMSQEIINGIKDRKIYLKSENGALIELNLIEILKGQMQLTQAIFRPATLLKPNTTYYLQYLDPNEKPTRDMSEYYRKKEPVFWKTTHLKSKNLLNPNLSIEFDKNEVIYYGCGPAVNIIFNVKNKSNSEIWYKTEVIEIETNIKTTFYIREFNGKLEVGHGMCAGAFIFKNKGKYKVRFTPMNTDGKSLKTTEWKTYDSPFLDS